MTLLLICSVLGISEFWRKCGRQEWHHPYPQKFYSYCQCISKFLACICRDCSHDFSRRPPFDTPLQRIAKDINEDSLANLQFSYQVSLVVFWSEERVRMGSLNRTKNSCGICIGCNPFVACPLRYSPLLSNAQVYN